MRANRVDERSLSDQCPVYGLVQLWQPSRRTIGFVWVIIYWRIASRIEENCTDLAGYQRVANKRALRPAAVRWNTGNAYMERNRVGGQHEKMLMCE